jgi:hypothetical protein
MTLRTSAHGRATDQGGIHLVFSKAKLLTCVKAPVRNGGRPAI